MMTYLAKCIPRLSTISVLLRIRIQCTLIRLQKHDVKMMYTLGKQMLQTSFREQLTNMKALTKTNVLLVTSLQSRSDIETLKKLKRMIVSRWLEQKSDCPLRVQDYWTCKTGLSVVADIVFKGYRFVMPPSMRKDVLQLLHKRYLGEEKYKRRAP